MKISSLLELKKEIGNILTSSEYVDFPIEILYSRGIEHKKFIIKIEEVKNDFFIDRNGNKWERVKEKKVLMGFLIRTALSAIKDGTDWHIKEIDTKSK